MSRIKLPSGPRAAVVSGDDQRDMAPDRIEAAYQAALAEIRQAARYAVTSEAAISQRHQPADPFTRVRRTK